MAQEKSIKWISVQDYLPSFEKEVLVWVQYKELAYPDLMKLTIISETEEGKTVYFRDSDYNETSGITHWAEINPPENTEA